MKIKGLNNEEYNVTGQGQGTFNTVGAAAGIASLLGINLNGLLNGVLNGGQPIAAYQQNPNALAALIAAIGGNLQRSDSNELITLLATMLPLLISAMKPSEVSVTCSEDKTVTRHELNMVQELAAKDGKIALLESNIYTDQKIADVYERLNVKIQANKDAQDAVNLQQAVLNGKTTSALECMKNEIASLASLSELVVPANRVCNTGCGCGCN